MDSALLISNLDNPLHHLRALQPQDLPPNQQTCNICQTPWGSPREYPVILPCSCIAGSSCVELSFQTSPRCPLCHATVRLIPGVNAPLPNHAPNRSLDRLRHLELRSGILEWPIPSIETTFEDGQSLTTEDEGMKHDSLQNRLGVLNDCHGTFLSARELEICASLVDWRLGGTAASTVEGLLDAFFRFPLFDPDRGQRMERMRAYMQGRSETFGTGTNGADMRDVLVLINTRAGTSFLLDELELVVSLVNYFHGRNVGLLEVLGLGGEGFSGGWEESRVVDGEFVKDFGTLDIRVGARNSVEDLGDVFERASL